MVRKSAADKALEEAIKHAKALLGDDFKLPTVEEAKQAEKFAPKKKEQNSLAMEGILLSQHHKHPLAMKQCGMCGLTFQTNYCYVAYCSDHCRHRAFKRDYGVDWNAITPSPSFWEYEEPFIIRPDQVDRLYQWAKAYVHQFEAGLIQEAPNPDQIEEPQPALTESAHDAPSSPLPQTPQPDQDSGRDTLQASPLDMPADLMSLDFDF